MAKKVFNIQGGMHSSAAYSALENRAFGSCVANAASFVVTPGTGMNLDISTGDGLISVDNFNARRIQTTAVETVAVPPSSASFNRIDSVVAYIDTSVDPDPEVVDNINNILKFMVVAGTAASTPAAPTGSAIQSAIGAGNPYVVYYDVTVPQSATNTAGVTLSDRRKLMISVDTAQLAAKAVTREKLSDGVRGMLEYSTSEVDTGMKWVNGKTIYKKTVSFGTLPNATTKTVAHGITGLDFVIEVGGAAKNPTTPQFVPLPYVQSSSGITFQVDLAIVGADIRVRSVENSSAYTSSYVTILYTKV